ncbi:MAG: hypothetical protein ABS62_01810 [Microbacterium sp. SCN 70-200]|uniref:hypothetical protein n=1 Tax=unclassified Microbacterium TaxID=2609290 RepID=UPI00086D327A|nr:MULTISPECIES: hypothetical protein [unclassified Microbacterium]MBN9215226.1 hypothetical protein [Microbacterium sp.]ODT42638.1 MAG: hypothetical protein ABS62_01810 [Microbacterium sp. SCN 70-200]OJV80019.1 MAG: hypothetical protein BGO46_07220 [Microbacterium sp. 70-16]
MDADAQARAHAVFDPIVQRLLASRDDVDLGPMFGVEGVRVRGKVFACVGYESALMLKLPRERVDELEASGAARRVVMRERPMKEWAFVGMAEASQWDSLMREALAFVDAITPRG